MICTDSQGLETQWQMTSAFLQRNRQLMQSFTVHIKILTLQRSNNGLPGSQWAHGTIQPLLRPGIGCRFNHKGRKCGGWVQFGMMLEFLWRLWQTTTDGNTNNRWNRNEDDYALFLIEQPNRRLNVPLAPVHRLMMVSWILES